MDNCYCGSEKKYMDCCEPYITLTKKAATAELLMRSRYSAYAVAAVDYLWATTLPQSRKYYSKLEIKQWTESNQWLKLEIYESTVSTVEFRAYFLDSKLEQQLHYEKSTFVFENGDWYYADGSY